MILGSYAQFTDELMQNRMSDERFMIVTDEHVVKTRAVLSPGTARSRVNFDM